MLKAAEKVLWRLGASPVAPRAAAAPWQTTSKRSKAPVTVILDKDGTVSAVHIQSTS